MSALEIRQLTVTYNHQPVLSDLNAVFPVGKLSAIVGPNGAGKSTLLKAILGLIPTDGGQILIEGIPTKKALDRVAYVPQTDSIDWDFPITAKEIVEMGRYRAAGWFRSLRGSDRQIVAECLAQVGMSNLGSRQIGELSGGQRQRLFVARALAQKAKLLLLDEPFAGIDIQTEIELLALMQKLSDEGCSIIVVHHNIEVVREKFDWALLLNGCSIACGVVDESLSTEKVQNAYGVPSNDRKLVKR